MKILLINGSPRKTSTTFRVVQQIANVMREGDFPVEFDEVHLCEMNLRMCRGCYQCLSGDESMCPLQDDRALLEKKMTEADAVIFSSPVYVANVSALFKNFVDRFAYCCHRPRFHGKSAMVVSSAGSDGAGIVNILMTMMIETWGFDVVKRLGVNLDPNLSVEAKTRQWKINELKAHKAALAFDKKLQRTRKPVAKFAKLYAFQLQKKDFAHTDKTRADYIYWRDNGWLAPRKSFYIDASINPAKLILARLLAGISRRS